MLRLLHVLTFVILYSSCSNSPSVSSSSRVLKEVASIKLKSVHPNSKHRSIGVVFTYADDKILLIFVRSLDWGGGVREAKGVEISISLGLGSFLIESNSLEEKKLIDLITHIVSTPMIADRDKEVLDMLVRLLKNRSALFDGME